MPKPSPTEPQSPESIERRMRAVVLAGARGVRVEQRCIAAPVADQVLVRVVGAGCNRADLLQRDGLYPAPAGAPVDVPGLEFAGTVEAVGSGVLTLATGDRVMGITGGGAHAEYLLVPEALCVEVPAQLDLLTAGALPETAFTAFEALVVQGGVRPGARVFVNAVGSGVGTALVQLAGAFGARVVGTTRSAAKLERARDLGLHAGLVVDGSEQPEELAEQVRALAGGDIDLAVDLLGGAHLEQAAGTLRVAGRIVVLGFLAGTSSTVDVRVLVSRRLSVVGTSLRSRPDHEKAVLAGRFAREALPLVADGLLSPVVDRVFDLAEAEQAYAHLESNQTFGKVLLRTGTSERSDREER